MQDSVILRGFPPIMMARWVDNQTKLYISYRKGRRTLILKHGSKTLVETTRISTLHEVLSRFMTQRFKFFFVFAQPDIRYKTKALLALCDLIPDLPRKVGILVSYALMDPETLECVRVLRERGFEIILDSGAFHVLEKKVPLSKYQEWLREYVEFANQHLDLFDWVVAADVPCDQRPARSIQELPNLQKIHMTIDNAVFVSEHLQDPRKLMVVVQGYNPHEYRYCAESLKQLGLVTVRMGVGSLCIRKYEKDQIESVHRILKTVKEVLPGWVRLHAFGLNVRFLEHREIAQYLGSSDSDAWVYAYSRFSRLLLCRSDGSFVEIDLKTATRRFQFAVNLDRISVYRYALLSYIERLIRLGLLS